MSNNHANWVLAIGCLMVLALLGLLTYEIATEPSSAELALEIRRDRAREVKAREELKALEIEACENRQGTPTMGFDYRVVCVKELK